MFCAACCVLGTFRIWWMTAFSLGGNPSPNVVPTGGLVLVQGKLSLHGMSSPHQVVTDYGRITVFIPSSDSFKPCVPPKRG